VDVGDLDQIDAMVRQAILSFGQIDILINNASVTRSAYIMDVTERCASLPAAPPQQRRFVAIARRRYERRDDVAVAIAEGDDLVALQLLVAAEAEVVAPFLADVVVPSPSMTVVSRRLS
jgi:hypothetical protein